MFGRCDYSPNMIRNKDSPSRELIERDAANLLGELIFSGDTSKTVNWTGLAKWLESPPPALTDRERVELLLKVANGKPLSGAEWNALTGAPTVVGADQLAIPAPPAVRPWIIPKLGVAADANGKDGDTAKRRRVFVGAARECEGNVLLVPDFRPGRKHRIIARTVGAALVYSIMLVTDDAGSLAAGLRRCPYSQCRRFFLRQPKVGQPLKACQPEHGRLYDNEEAVKRMRKRRKDNQ
jgi:hypothetical protein